VKVGDLVKYNCPETNVDLFGFITDTMEGDDGWNMYEVICTDPYDRGWYSDIMLKVISESREAIE
jgi:hypothetical protein